MHHDNDSDIQKGAKVVLRSGGAEMTVQTRSQNLAYCSWEEDGVMREGTFTLDALRLASLAPGEALTRESPVPAQDPVVALMAQPGADGPVHPPAGEAPEPD
jgi:uncharacterized protein YodC (DUF2158 family)